MSTDTVFILRGDRVQSLPSRPFRAGLGDKSLEEALQNLLSSHPDLIPGDQIAPDSSQPPRFALLGAELTLDGRFSVDHVMVDQHGNLMLIETKLFENPESRRDVIGQILEYAALALAEWGSGGLRDQAAAYWSRRGRILDDVLQDRFGFDLDIDQYWAEIETRIRNGSLRLLIAGDRIRPDVRRVIELLNTEMANIDILGLELGFFGEDGEQFVLVPRIVGQTIRAADRKPGTQHRWSPTELREFYRNLATDEPVRSRRLEQSLDWAIDQALYVESTAVKPCFAIGDNGGTRLVTVNPDGLLHWYAGESVYDNWGGEPARRRFYEGLVELRLAGPAQDPVRVKSSRDLLRRIEDLSDDEFERFKSLILEVLGDLD